MLRFLFTLLTIAYFCVSQAQLKKYDLPLESGHRAMEICANGSVLFAGSKGSVALYNPLSGILSSFEVDTDSLEFRSATVLSDSVFIIANAGSPALIYKSIDAGQTWSKRYENKHSSAFIDGMVPLADGHLIAYGDQIDGRFLFLESLDGGNSWERKDISVPGDKTEAGFAASDAGMLSVGDSLFVAISGQNGNYVLCSPNKGVTWHKLNTSLKTGEGSGIFATTYSNGNLVLAGGSYLDFNNSKGNIQILNPVSGRLLKVESAPRGYRSGIACKNSLCLSTGTLGTDISYDGGLNWKPLDDERYFAVRYANDRFYLSGPKGGFATFK
jgi:photosystem II stability/assembly factor-like uncharacterized protein